MRLEREARPYYYPSKVYFKMYPTNQPPNAAPISSDQLAFDWREHEESERLKDAAVEESASKQFRIVIAVNNSLHVYSP